MAPTTQESRKRAKEKLEKLPKSVTSKNALPQSKIALSEYLISWLDDAHKHQIAIAVIIRFGQDLMTSQQHIQKLQKLYTKEIRQKSVLVAKRWSNGNASGATYSNLM
jgi:hypothetical protein